MAFYRLFLSYITCLAVLVYAENEDVGLSDDHLPITDNQMQNLLTDMYFNDMMDGNEDTADQYNKRRVPGFVGKRGRMFVGKKSDIDEFDEDKRGPAFVGKRGRMFVGKKSSADETKRGRMFIGKRDEDSLDKRSRMFVGKKSAYGPREARLFVGKKSYPYTLDDIFDDDNNKRARFFVGKKSSPFYIDDDIYDADKRERMFVGKKSSDNADWQSFQQYLNSQMADKRNRMFVGKRRLFVGKRTQSSESGSDSESNKRARFFVGKRSINDNQLIADSSSA